MTPIVEENKFDRYFVLKGPKGASAVELVYDGTRAVVSDGSLRRSLKHAKTLLRAYQWFAYRRHDGYVPSDRWATLRPVRASTREAELDALREASRRRFPHAG